MSGLGVERFDSGPVFVVSGRAAGILLRVLAAHVRTRRVRGRLVHPDPDVEALFRALRPLPDPVSGVIRQAESELIDAVEAGVLLGVTDRQVRRRGTALGGWKISGRWVFDRAVILEHLDGGTLD